MLNGAIYMRRELLIRLVRAFDDGSLRAELDHIPVKLRPKDQLASRCCIYHDRAVLKYRLMALLGVAPEEETDETKPLAAYYDDLVARVGATLDAHAPPPDAAAAQPRPPLSVCGCACSACPDAKIVSTPNCRGCFSRPCTFTCPKKAITVVRGQSVIDAAKCIKCGKCITACPYHAIVRTTVPCEDACPVGAIHKNEQGVAEIDFAKCIYCGKCFEACPFSAVMERSQLLEVLLAMQRGEHLVAMVAPAADRQFPGTIEQLLAACMKAGFADVLEVALGAELTTEHETKEFVERMAADPKALMTTSCCPAYVNFVRKHLPAFLPHVSTTPSPMVYAKQLAREKDPAAKTVFIGPCVAKRGEAREKGVDYVLSFEELGALLAGRKIDVMACEPWPVPRPAAVTARNFARSCGVTEAVLAEATKTIPGFTLKAKQISGIDKKTAALLRVYGMGKLPENFIEVMACPGGCVNGPCSLK